MKFLTLAVAVLTVFFGTAQAGDENTNPDFADYAVLAGISPFGGSFSFAHNSSEQTTWVFSNGGNADMNLDIEIESEDYELAPESSGWDSSSIIIPPKCQMVSTVAGLGVGSIETTLSVLTHEGWRPTSVMKRTTKKIQWVIWGLVSVSSPKGVRLGC